jgi:DnaJ like chaperone protein
VAGFEEYARKIARMFEQAHDTLFDLMEGLFVIAVADGDYHAMEDDYLARVAKIFGITDREFKALRAQFVPDAEPDPWDVLGVDPDTPMDQVRAAWRKAVRESHFRIFLDAMANCFSTIIGLAAMTSHDGRRSRRWGLSLLRWMPTRS